MSAEASDPLDPPGGFAIGHWTAEGARTGCTVILPPAGSRAGVDVRGGGPGTRETEIIGPLSNPEEATAVLFTGGSAHGLAAADGVMRWCEEHDRGYRTPGGLVPLVPTAVIYDLTAGSANARPGAPEGYAACEAASEGVPARGSVGAARGAAVAKARGREHASPGGVGYASARNGAGETVAAVAVVNATGDVLAEDGSILAGPRGDDGETLRSAELLANVTGPPEWAAAEAERQGTTLVCVMTDAALDKVRLLEGRAHGRRRRRPRDRSRLHALRRRHRLLPRLRRGSDRLLARGPHRHACRDGRLRRDPGRRSPGGGGERDVSRAVEESNRRMLRVRDLMDRNYAEPLDLRGLAAAVHVSESHLIRKFRSTFGETPHRYLQRRRIERAMFMLRETDTSVSRICLDVGFTSLGAFSRTFAEIVGVPPSEYRLRAERQVAPTSHSMTYSRPSSFGEARRARAS